MMNLYNNIKNDELYIIAEMSANHAGKLENAFTIIEESAKAGADCIKIQTYTQDTLTIDCNRSEYKIHGGLWDGYTFYKLYSDAMTPWEWHDKIKNKCESVGVDFLSTPFDFTAVDFLEKMGVEFYKIASPELVDIPLIEYTAKKGKPMIISCGMGNVEDIWEAIEACKKVGNDNIVLLKCCSQYPTKYENAKISLIADMKKRFKLPVGLSDHSFGSLVPVLAVGFGAEIIEKHVCISRDIKSPDSGFSMEISEFARMVEDVRNAKVAIGSPDYALTDGEKEGLNGRRSLVAVKGIKAGENFTEDNIRSIRPSIGIRPKYYYSLLGKQAKKEYEYGEPISDIEID